MKKFFKHKSLLVLLVAILSTFLIYTVNADKKVRYIALGDSVAAGQNPYGEIGYGYTDYIANYLEKNDLLKSYTKDYAVSGYRTRDVLNDIKTGKLVTINGVETDIKKALRESNLVTISIGANDFLERINLEVRNLTLPSLDNLKVVIDEVMENVDKTIGEVRKYAKGKVIMVGYYNPLPRVLTDDTMMDEVFSYAKEKYETIANKYQAEYIDVYEVMKKETDYLPNPFDIHPSTKGYEMIAKQVIDHLESN